MHFLLFVIALLFVLTDFGRRLLLIAGLLGVGYLGLMYLNGDIHSVRSSNPVIIAHH